MGNPFLEIKDSLKTALASAHSKHMFAVLAALAFVAFVLIPVLSIPGNDLRFYLTVLRPVDYAVYALLAATISAIIMMQVFLFQKSRDSRKRLASAAQGGVGAYAAVLGGLLATATCSSCIAGLLGFLGAGAVLFVAQNSSIVAGIALLVSMFSLYMSSRKVNGHCQNCCEDACK